MLCDEPAWTVEAPRPLTHDQGHVVLLPEHALGQWICVRRDTGHVLWRHDFDRPNAVKGVTDRGVIIATEQLPVGLMGGGGFDCYALELETGKLLWTTHPSGTCGERSAEQYWYPDRYDHRGGAAEPRLVEDETCFCEDGRALDATSGEARGRISEEDVKLRAMRQRADLGSSFYWCRGPRCTGVAVAPGHRLSYRRRGNALTIHLAGDDGHERWAFDPRRHGYEVVHPNFYNFRLAGRYVYVVASEPLPPEPTPPPGNDRPRPLRAFRLLTVELEHGTVCQDFPVGDAKLGVCRIEDVDGRGLLLSSGSTEPRFTSSGNVLRYFARRDGLDRKSNNAA